MMNSDAQSLQFWTRYLLPASVWLTLSGPLALATPPADNPVAHYGLEWTDAIRWDQTVSITDYPGTEDDERLQAAQNALAAKGGGVVYFPAGAYTFQNTILLKDGIVLRGADPRGVPGAGPEAPLPPTRFEFPRYQPAFEGQGTPNHTAFKGIHLEDPGQASRCGVVHIALNHGHIFFGRDREERGRDRIVYGCAFQHAALIEDRVPNLEMGQHAWQRFPKWHQAAVDVRTRENALVAGNRFLPATDNFLMPGYVLPGRGANQDQRIVPEPGVWFDYDNRPAISVNLYAIGGGGGQDPKGTPETHPDGFRTGIVIRDNHIFSTGRSAIGFTGDGTICAFNTIRFQPDVVRWTNTGFSLAAGSSTNDTRAILARGWRWLIEGNDYEVYRNRAGDSGYYINDGEGIMHEGHVNSVIRDSRLINNRGNAYLSIYKTAGIDGLLIAGNDIRPQGPGTDTRIASIFVDANRTHDQHFCRNVRIENNITMGTGILLAGDPAEKNIIRGNRSVGDPGRIINRANAVVEDNENYEILNDD